MQPEWARAPHLLVPSLARYDLRHAFASLLIHEGRLSVVEIAAQLGHNPTVGLDTYAHVMAEQRGAERISAEEQIALARSEAGDKHAGGRTAFVRCLRCWQP